MEIVKILGICFIAAVLAVLLRQYKSEYALIVGIAAGIAVLISVTGAVIPAFSQLQAALKAAGLDVYYFSVVLKAIGIGYITQFIADSCRDCGQTAIAVRAELAGRCAIFLLALPMLKKILELAQQML